MAEITDLVDLSAWPEGTRMIARREEPHPGAQLTFTDVDGHRYQVFVTDHRDDDVCFLEALYRGRGRCERRICDPRTPGWPTALGQLRHQRRLAHPRPHRRRPVGLDKGALPRGRAGPAEPKRLRYTLLHTAGLMVRSARRTTVRIAAGWPWADELVAAFARLPNWSSV